MAIIRYGTENRTRNMISQTLQSIEYLLLAALLVMYWRRAFRESEMRRFWVLLALAWTMNLFGNIAWIVHDLVTGTALGTLSYVDLFYVLQYIFLGLAVWQFPASLPGRVWLWICGAMLTACVVVWAVYFDPAMALTGGDWTGFLGLAMYPVLDAGMTALAWLRVRAVRESQGHRFAFLLFFAVISYGIANTLNLTEYVFPPLSGGVLPALGWILRDVFLLILVLTPAMPALKQGTKHERENSRSVQEQTHLHALLPVGLP